MGRLPNIEKWLVQVDERNNAMLKVALFDVNMRLYNNNDVYKRLITDIIDHMIDALHRKYANYPEIRGISGANVGIPFNIVVIKIKKAMKTVDGIFINPKYKRAESSNVITVASNCGSLRLEKDIPTKRYDAINMSYFSIDGVYVQKRVDEREVCTLQHEIDHNNGILITDC